MKANKGIALIASLLIMVAIMAMGIGSMFLTNMSLRIAENTRSSVVAKYNAEAGVDTATVLLTQQFEANGKRFPATWTMPATATYRLLPDPNNAADNGYVRYSSTRARVRIEGLTPNNARYVAETLLGSASTINPAFEIGMASMSNVRVSGGGQAEFINAGVHSNTQLDLPGYTTDRFRTCPIGVTFASCPVVFNPLNYNSATYNPYQVPGPYLPVTTSNGTNCYMTPWCRNREREINIDVKYVLKRNDNIATSLGFVDPDETGPDGLPLPLYYRDADGKLVPDGAGGFLYAHPCDLSTPININPEANPNLYTTNYNKDPDKCPKPPDTRCDITYSNANLPPATITTVAANAKICAKDGRSLNFASGINMTGVTVVADGDITFGGACSATATSCMGTAGNLTDTKLISRSKLASDRGGVMLGTVRGHNLTIFGGANNNITGNLTGANQPYYLIGSGFNLTGNTTIASNRNITFEGQTQVTTYPTDANKAPEIQVAIISTRDIMNSGSSDFYGVFWAGGTYNQSGSTKIYGALATVGEVRADGKFHINSTYALNNSSLYAPPDATVMSRR